MFDERQITNGASGLDNRSLGVKERKEEITEKCIAVFVENGIEKTSVRDLCNAAKIHSATMYYYFESKDDVIMACFRHEIAVADSTMQAMIDLQLPSIKDTLDAMFEEISKHAHGIRFMAQVLASPNHCSACQIEMKALHKRYDKYARQISDYYGISYEMFRPMFYIYLTIIYDFFIKGDEEYFKVQSDAVYKGIERMI